MPARGREIPILFNGFLGTNIAVDPATLPHTVLQRSENWIPSPAYTLTRRPGINATENDIGFSGGVPASTRFTYQGHRYTYAVTNIFGAALNDTIIVEIDDNYPFSTVTGGDFSGAGIDTYDLTRYGDSVYVGNGLHAIKKIPIGGAAVDLSPLVSFTDGSAAASVTADPGSRLITGTYSYVWAVYDDSSRRWVARGDSPRTFTITVSDDQSLSFPTPTVSYTLAGAQKYHLFVAPVNLPIEYAHDQTPGGVTSGNVVVRGVTVEQTPVPMVGYITRRGKYLLNHRGRVWAGHDRTFADGARRIYATNILLPGYEQAIFDQGDFWPANAVIQLPLELTGMGIVSLTGTQRSPSAPLALFTQTQTWLWMGDILDDPNADLIQRSDRVGCVSHHAIVTTPFGLVFPSVESVYLLTPDGSLVDLGWPIQNVLRSVTPIMRPRMLGVYHEGFYKLALAPDGEIENTTMWWLDLRRGLGSVPSWWGPHTIAHADARPQTWCIGTDETTVDERLFSWSSHGIGSEHNGGGSDHGTAFTARLRTGLVDLGQPFERKLATRVRIVAKPGDTTTINATVIADEALSQNFGDIPLTADGALWDVGVWDVALWGTTQFQEGTALAEADRLRGQAFALELTSTNPTTIELRHGELALLPIDRTMRESY